MILTSPSACALAKWNAEDLPTHQASLRDNVVTWNDTFLDLFNRCVVLYRTGNHDFETYYTGNDLLFLQGIGCKKREFFDFVEDYCEDGTPSPSTALLIAAVRRDYFMTEQNNVHSNAPLLTRDEIPGFGENLMGIAYLPRILAKASAKLRGLLDPDLMFGCGGDRNFLRKHGNIHPADFLHKVWATGDNGEEVAKWIIRSLTHKTP
jgi:hypothetical protein